VLADLAAEVETRYWDMGDEPWLAWHAPEYDDLQVAFDRACALREVRTAAVIGTALQRMDHLRSVATARRRRAELLFAMLDEADDEARAWIWSCLTSHNMISLEIVSRLEASTQAGGGVAAHRRRDAAAPRARLSRQRVRARRRLRRRRRRARRGRGAREARLAGAPAHVGAPPRAPACASPRAMPRATASTCAPSSRSPTAWAPRAPPPRRGSSSPTRR
jgi:hypothetical protein